jgi:hypothetical protein
MNWDQIISISENPNVTIGAHSVNHLALNKIFREALEKEMMDSQDGFKKNLERKLNTFVTLLVGRRMGKENSKPQELADLKRQLPPGSQMSFLNIAIISVVSQEYTNRDYAAAN